MEGNNEIIIGHFIAHRRVICDAGIRVSDADCFPAGKRNTYIGETFKAKFIKNGDDGWIGELPAGIASHE